MLPGRLEPLQLRWLYILNTGVVRRVQRTIPAEFEEMKHDEKALGFTLDNKCDLETYIEGAKPCLYKGDKEAIHSLITGIFTESDIFIDGVWKYPAGAFHGAEGESC